MSGTVSRVGEPVLKRGPEAGSVKRQNQYEIRTTPLPAGPKGANWRGYFNSRLTGGQFLAEHDGASRIVAECWPDDEPNLTEVVDAAIEYANEKTGTNSH